MYKFTHIYSLHFISPELLRSTALKGRMKTVLYSLMGCGATLQLWMANKCDVDFPLCGLAPIVLLAAAVCTLLEVDNLQV